MNRDQAINTFVKNGFHELTSGKYDRKLFKQLRNTKFPQAEKKKMSLPSEKETCRAIVLFMQRRGIPIETIHEVIYLAPIFDYYGKNFQDEMASLIGNNKHETILDEEARKKIKNFNAVEAVSRSMEEKIRKETEERIKKETIEKEKELEEIQKEIEREKQEYKSLPSILDKEEIGEPDFDPQLENKKTWWQRFYLKQNPFESKAGLAKIQRNHYEDVVVKTKPFKETLSKIEKDPNYLLDTAIPLLGDFGYGKSTFMEYLSYYLTSKNIVTGTVSMPYTPFNDCAGYLNHFFIELNNVLAEEAKLIHNNHAQKIDEKEPESTVFEYAKIITERKSGIVIFLEDYHKMPTFEDVIFEFLGGLQLLKDGLIRNDIPVGFIVAGVPKWENQIQKKPQMSGFFDTEAIMMPDVTVEDMCELFNQRIAAYCYENSPREISVPFIERMLYEAPGESYRSYLTRIIQKLENNNMEIVKSPIEIDETELKQIKYLIEEDDDVKNSFGNLAYRSKFKNYVNEQIVKCLELVIQLYDGIHEKDQLFQENPFYFKRLNELGFMQKRRTGEDTFKWVLHKRIRNRVDLVEEKYNKTLNDYLIRIYAGEVIATTQTENENISSNINNLKKLLNNDKLPTITNESLEKALLEYDSVKALNPTNKDTEILKRNLERMENSLQCLSFTLFSLDGTLDYFQKADMSYFESRWDFHWSDIEAVLEFSRRKLSYEEHPARDRYEKAYSVFRDAFDQIAELLRQIHLDIEEPTSNYRLPYLSRVQYLTPKTIELCDQINYHTTSFDSEQHYEYTRNITEHLEHEFRTFLFLTTVALFGQENYFNDIRGIRKHPQHIIQDKSFLNETTNKFATLGRAEYRNVFMQTPKIRDQIIPAMNIPWSPEDLDYFFQLFNKHSKDCGHAQKEVYKPSERQEYFKLCQMSILMIEHINKLRSRLFNEFCFVLRSQESSNDIPFFSFNQKRQDSEVEDGVFSDLNDFHNPNNIYLSKFQEEVVESIDNQIHRLLKSQEQLVENLGEIEILTKHYGYNLEEILFSLAYLYKVEKIIDIIPWTGGQILIKKG